jgi:hypothetical protein
MPTYEITAPDGKVLEITAPEGATQEQVLAYAQAQYKPTQRAPAAPQEAPDPTEGMSFLDRVRAGFGKSFVDTARGSLQAATEAIAIPFSNVANIYGRGGARDVADTLNVPARKAAEMRAEETERQRLDAPLMATGGGVVGNIAGTLTQLAGPAYLARGSVAAPAFLPRTTAGNAVQGGILGMIQPVGTDDSRLANTGIGAGAGAIGAALPQLAGSAVRAGRSVFVDPITQRGQERIVARAIQQSATDPARLVVQAPSAFPGVTRSLAEESADPGIANLQRQFPAQMADLMARNNAARTAAVRSTFEGADDASIAAIRAARDADAGQVLGGLPGAPAPDMAPVRRAIETAIESKRGFGAAQRALREFLDDMPAAINSAEEAYNIRKQIDFILSKQSDKPAAQAASKELLAAKGVLDREMKKVFPEWGDYLDEYVSQSKRMDQAKVGKSLLGMARQAADPNTSERSLGANALSRAANDPDALVRGATRFNKSTAGNTLTAEQSNLLRMLGDDASRMDFAATGGRAVGSDTAQNLATRNILSTLAGGSRLANMAMQTRPAQHVAALGEKTYGLLGVPERLQSVMVEALSDPARAREILGRLPGPDRSLVEQALGNVSRRLAVGSVPALTE